MLFALLIISENKFYIISAIINQWNVFIPAARTSPHTPVNILYYFSYIIIARIDLTISIPLTSTFIT